MHELEHVFVRGATPDLDALVGWEFRGINHLPLNALPIAQLVGIKKFVKGFYRGEDGRVMGYNSRSCSNVLDGRWHAEAERRRAEALRLLRGRTPVDRDRAATTRTSTRCCSTTARAATSASIRRSGLRDYLVQVDPANPDLFLGKAYYALGPARVATNFFILERHRVGLTDYVRR